MPDSLALEVQQGQQRGWAGLAEQPQSAQEGPEGVGLQQEWPGQQWAGLEMQEEREVQRGAAVRREE